MTLSIQLGNNKHYVNLVYSVVFCCRVFECDLNFVELFLSIIYGGCVYTY